MKKLMFVLGFVVLVAIGGVLLLPILVPMDVVAAKVKEQVKLSTGRDINFSGVKFVFFPNLGVALTDVTLSNPSWATDRNMLTLGKADVALALQPLLQKQIEVKRFVLDAPVIHLEVGANGKNSWDFTPENAANTGKAAAAPAAEREENSSAMKTGNFDLKFGKLQVTKGKLTFMDKQKGSLASVDDINMTADLHDIKSALHVEGSLTYRKKRVDLTLDLTKPMEFMQGGTSPGQMNLKTDDLSVKSAGVLAMQGEMFNGNVETNVSSLAGLLAWAGGGQQQKLPFEKVSFTSAVRATKTDLVLKDADLMLDEVHAKGNMNIGFAGKPDIFARLSLNKLNLDRFTGGSPAAAKGGSAATENADTQKSSGWDAAPIDLSGLKAVNADLELKTEGFSVSGADVGPSVLTVTLQNGNLNFKSSEASLFEGKLSSDLNVNAAASTMGFNFKMSGVQAKPVLTKFAHFKNLSGTADASVSVTSSGNSQKALISNLKGNGSTVFKNGSLEGIDLVNIAKLVQKHLTDLNVGAGKTDFVELGGTFVIANGIATNNDLKMKGPLLQATGKGTIDLPQKYIQYRVIPVLTASSAVENASGIAVPVDIKGPFSNIKVIPDFASVVKDIMNNPAAAKQTLKNVQDQGKLLLKGLKQDPTKALQGLLGGGLLGAPAPAAQPQAAPEPAPAPQTAP